MRTISLSAFFINIVLLNIVLHSYNSDNVRALWTMYQQTEKIINKVAATGSLVQANGSVTTKFYTDKEESVFTSGQSTRKINKPAARAVNSNDISSGPAELTLEYIAIQLPRSHNLK
jgi:hypothetical protein